MTHPEPTPFPTSEPSPDRRIRPISPDDDAWLTELERNDPEAARGQRQARMYGWTWNELMRFRLSGEIPLWMEVDPFELERSLAEQRRRKTEAPETSSKPEMIDPQIEAYCRIDGLAPIFEWENLHEEWETLARAKGIADRVIAEVSQTLHQLVERIVESCVRYAATLRAFAKVQTPKNREVAIERSNMDASRRRSHNALIDHATIIQRFVRKFIPERYGVELSQRIFDPRALQVRDQVAHWAILTDYFIQVRDLTLRRDIR